MTPKILELNLNITVYSKHNELKYQGNTNERYFPPL